MTIEMRYPENHLYHRYPNQTQPQSTHLDLDPAGRLLVADCNWEIGNAVSMDVWHGRTRRYNLPSVYLTAGAIRALMDEIVPLCERVCNGYECDWDGQNNVGCLDDDARDAEDEIERALEKERVDQDDEIVVVDAPEWFQESRPEILLRIKNGEGASAILNDLTEGDVDGRPLVIENVKDFTDDLLER